MVVCYCLSRETNSLKKPSCNHETSTLGTTLNATPYETDHEQIYEIKTDGSLVACGSSR
jgi:hypothetical protein